MCMYVCMHVCIMNGLYRRIHTYDRENERERERKGSYKHISSLGYKSIQSNLKHSQTNLLFYNLKESEEMFEIERKRNLKTFKVMKSVEFVFLHEILTDQERATTWGWRTSYWREWPSRKKKTLPYVVKLTLAVVAFDAHLQLPPRPQCPQPVRVLLGLTLCWVKSKWPVVLWLLFRKALLSTSDLWEQKEIIKCWNRFDLLSMGLFLTFIVWLKECPELETVYSLLCMIFI